VAAALSGGRSAVNGQVSFWHATLGGRPQPRPGLNGPVEADVCIVGAGYTGLWAAWALSSANPALRVVIVEAAFAGFGASGRNGGWLSGLMPGDRGRLARERGREAVVSLQRQLFAAVREVPAVCRQEGIDADIQVGGTMAVATAPAQLRRLREQLNESRDWGVGPEDAGELSAAEISARIRVTGALGGVFSPHCARIQPAKLVLGLAGAVERNGVTIFEASPALAVGPGWVRTPSGEVRARWVLRATEGFTPRLAGAHRALLPMNSSMIVTEPLPDHVWTEIGWSGMETLRDAAHRYVYAQRTADGRIALGGRGRPYRFGSRGDADGFTPRRTVTELRRSLGRLFPGAAEVGLAHAWSGVLGVARDWCPSVGLDRTSGIGWAGGYVGDGVAMSYLGGRTLADLVVGADTERTASAWVGHRSRLREPEPLRWLGVHAIYLLYGAADRSEARAPDRFRRGADKTSTWARLADRISGKP
jgi:glycine/D-amino acid oxidase-like deaminating enzyme